MNGFVRATTAVGVAVAACSVACDAFAQAPTDNTSLTGARVAIPDGTSLYQSAGGPDVRWYAFTIEPGKTYVVEALAPYDEPVTNSVTMGVYDTFGSPPHEANVDCTQASRAPSTTLNVNGARCVVRSFPPAPGTTKGKRAIYVSVTRSLNAGFQLRVRESTLYSRWTTNGYDFHVQLRNTTHDALCAQVTLYPDTGLSYSATWNGAIASYTLNVPAFGAAKTVIPAGTTVNGTNRGTMRVSACASPADLVPGALNVATYAYNPTTNGYLYFFATDANGGAAANSW